MTFLSSRTVTRTMWIAVGLLDDRAELADRQAGIEQGAVDLLADQGALGGPIPCAAVGRRRAVRSGLGHVGEVRAGEHLVAHSRQRRVGRVIARILHRADHQLFPFHPRRRGELVQMLAIVGDHLVGGDFVVAFDLLESTGGPVPARQNARFSCSSDVPSFRSFCSSSRAKLAPDPLHHFVDFVLVKQLLQLLLDLRPAFRRDRLFRVEIDQLVLDEVLQLLLDEDLASRVELLGRNAVLVGFEEIVDGPRHVAFQNHFRADVGKDAGAFARVQLVGGRQVARRRLRRRGRCGAGPGDGRDASAAASAGRRPTAGRMAAGRGRRHRVVSKPVALSGGYCAAHHEAASSRSQENADREPNVAGVVSHEFHPWTCSRVALSPDDASNRSERRYYRRAGL